MRCVDPLEALDAARRIALRQPTSRPVARRAERRWMGGGERGGGGRRGAEEADALVSKRATKGRSGAEGAGRPRGGGTDSTPRRLRRTTRISPLVGPGERAAPVPLALSCRRMSFGICFDPQRVRDTRALCDGAARDLGRPRRGARGRGGGKRLGKERGGRGCVRGGEVRGAGLGDRRVRYRPPLPSTGLFLFLFSFSLFPFSSLSPVGPFPLAFLCRFPSLSSVHLVFPLALPFPPLPISSLFVCLRRWSQRTRSGVRGARRWALGSGLAFPSPKRRLLASALRSCCCKTRATRWRCSWRC